MTVVTNKADRWIESTPAGEGPAVLTPGQITAWREQGFTLVSNLFPASLIDTLGEAAVNKFPAADSAAAQGVSDFGSGLCFPSPLAALNDLTLDARLLSSVSALLQTPVESLRLSQSELWPKYGRTEKSAGPLDNMDQRIHVDYPNHSLVHPTEWTRPEAVEMIVYLTDVENCGGPTAVVPREGEADPAYRWPIVDSPGIGDLDYVNDRVTAETYFSEQRPE